MSVWRVGTRVPINVYKDNLPVCQCQTPVLAAEIVTGMNRGEEDKREIERLRGVLKTQWSGRTP